MIYTYLFRMNRQDAVSSLEPERIARATGDRARIDEETIRELVHTFYRKVRRDPQLGPIFEKVIGSDWNVHLAKMCDFWSSVVLASGRYKGNPMVAHMRIKAIRPEHFERWLELFRMAAVETCSPEVAAEFLVRAKNIANTLQSGMFHRPARADAAQMESRP